MAFEGAVELTGKLKDLLRAEKLKECEPILSKLKIALTQVGFLPVGGIPPKKELHLAREILELGAQWGVKSGNIAAFERYMAQLKAYYFDFAAELDESAFMYELLGLNLLCLLSQNRIAEFHMELERLDTSVIDNSLYISHPVQLEQYVMEGAYNKVFLSKGNVPASTYSFFIDILLDTIREDIADCCEKAYKTLSKDVASKLLLLDSVNDIDGFAATRDWGSTANQIIFPEPPAEATAIESTEMMTRALGYARELEKIV
eukprot:m.432985 g.432985  ORF g.432985 m.432985 type:complete len:260 (+) comp17515_c0_seq1:51-830(+)